MSEKLKSRLNVLDQPRSNADLGTKILKNFEFIFIFKTGIA
jgi:hypothetical protein